MKAANVVLKLAVIAVTIGLLATSAVWAQQPGMPGYPPAAAPSSSGLPPPPDGMSSPPSYPAAPSYGGAPQTPYGASPYGAAPQTPYGGSPYAAAPQTPYSPPPATGGSSLPPPLPPGTPVPYNPATPPAYSPAPPPAYGPTTPPYYGPTTPPPAPSGPYSPPPPYTPSTPYQPYVTPAPGPAYPPPVYGPPPEYPVFVSPIGSRWSVDVGATLLSCSGCAHDLPLVFDNSTGATLVDAKDFNMGWGGGPRVGITRHFPFLDIEFLFYNVSGWGQTRTATDAGNLWVPTLTMTQFIDQASAAYTASLSSFEINFKHKFGEHFTAFAGFRWFDVDERIEVDGSSAAFDGSIVTHVDNSLWGLQLGGEGKLWSVKNTFHVDAFLKAGIYSNSAMTHQEMDTTEQAWTYDESDSHVAFAAEAGVSATWQFTPNFSATAGYEFLCLDALAQAPYQLIYAGSGQDPFQSSVYSQGANVTVQFTF